MMGIDINVRNDVAVVAHVEGSCPMLFRIKKGYQRYEVTGATNNKGDSIIYFRFGIGKQSVIKEDGSRMTEEEYENIPVDWICGLELNSSYQAEQLSKLFIGAADYLKEKEKENEPAVLRIPARACF